MIQEKITNLQTYCQAHNIDWLIAANFGHELSDAIVYYLLLTNPEHCILLIPSFGQPILYITPFEVHEVQQKFSEIEVRPLNEKFISLILNTVPTDKKIFVRTGVFPYQAYVALLQAGYSLVSGNEIEKILAKKTDAELIAMRDVTALTDECFTQLCSSWREFQTEREVARFVSLFAFENNVEISFPPIIGSGPHAAHPHHTTTSMVLQRGFCVIDMGLRLNGYCSDMTRTIFLGAPSLEEKILYERLRVVQEKTIALVAPGVALAGPDIFCRAELKDLNNYFIHGLGHGLGTQVHEWPGVTAKNTELIEPNMVITIEPGIYKENEFGIRIEDDILVTDTGNEVLTKSPKELLVFPLPL